MTEPQVEIWVDPADAKGYLCHVFSISSPSETQPAKLRYWVSAVAEGIVHYETEIYYQAEVRGTLTGRLWPASPLAGAMAGRPLPHMHVTMQDRTGPEDPPPPPYYINRVATADGSGHYFGEGVDFQRVSSSPRGPFAVVSNRAGDLIARGRPVNGPGPFDLDFNAATEFELAQVSAFYWTNAVHDFARSILADSQGDRLARLPVRVNRPGTCNAFWDGDSINFLRAGDGCPNTAYVDVVAHEYGHGIDSRRGGILNGGYSEGFGDAMAVLVTKQSCVGRDLLGAGVCLRNAVDVVTWPPQNEEIHAVGRIYAGFTWELIQQMACEMTQDEAYEVAKGLVLAAAAGNPSDIPDAVHLNFLADDDDGNLANGSPHFPHLAAAADSRHIPRPKFVCPPGPPGGPNIPGDKSMCRRPCSPLPTP